MFSNSDRWYFTKEQLNNSPSRKFGIDADKELAQRQQAANFIQDMGQRLQVTQLCINTAIVYMHRFYMFHSFTHFHRNTVATACLFLAAKVEEQPRKLEHIIKVAVLCLQKGQAGIPPPPPPPPERRTDFYAEQAQEVIQTENILLQTLGFDVAIDHPHTYVVKCCHLVGASKDLSQTSYFMASNSLHLTTMCLQYKPTVVACFCIHLACKWSNWEIPVSSEGKPWFYYVDPGVTQELLERLTEEFLIIFDKCPSRLKKRIMLLSHNQSSAGGSGGASTALSNYPFDADCRKAMQKRREESAAAKQAEAVFGGTSGNAAAIKVADGFNGATGQNTSTASNVTKQNNAVSNYNSLCTNSGTSGPGSGAAPRPNAIPTSNVNTIAATAGLHSNSYSAAASSHYPLPPASTYATAKSTAVPHKASSNNFAPASRQKVVSNNNINSNHNNGAHHTSQTSSEHRKSATAAATNFDSQQVRHHRKDGSIGNTMNANVGPPSGNGKFVAAVADSLHSDIISNVVKEVVMAKQNEKLNCLKAPKKEKSADYNNSKVPAAAANVVPPEQKSHSIFSPTFSLTESDNSANDSMFFERSSSCGAGTVGSLDSFASAMRAAASPPAPPPKNLNDRYLQRLQKQEQNKTSDAVCSNHSQITNNSTSSSSSSKEDVAGSEFASYDNIDRVAFDINDVIIGDDIVSNASSASSPPAINATLPVIVAGSAGGSHCLITDNEVAQSDAVINNCSSHVLINDVASSDDVADTANDSSLANYDADGSCVALHKKKKKHKEKDKHRDKEKKHHKEKKKHKEDKHHHHHHRHHHHHGNGKEYEEQSLIPAAPTKEIVEPIKITIPKEKLKDIPMRLKIKINKDQISNSSVTDSGPFKFKIGKDDGKRHTRKRTRADRGSDISADSYSSNSEDELRSSKRTNYYLC